MANGHLGHHLGRCDIEEILVKRLCLRCEKPRATVFVNRKDPKADGTLWRIEVCQTCGFNYDLEPVVEQEAKLIEGPQDASGARPWHMWKPS